MSFKKLWEEAHNNNIPKGWTKLGDIAKELGVTGGTACRKMRILKEKGLVETKSLLWRHGSGRTSVVALYRIKKK